MVYRNITAIIDRLTHKWYSRISLDTYSNRHVSTLFCYLPPYQQVRFWRGSCQGGVLGCTEGCALMCAAVQTSPVLNYMWLPTT